MSQVAKSASAFVRAFLAILVLELEDMMVRLVRLPKLAGVHGDRWTVGSPGLAHPFSWRSAAVCLKLGIDRTQLANCKNVEIDPTETLARASVSRFAFRTTVALRPPRLPRG
jgi:hypothetical protein